MPAMPLQSVSDKIQFALTMIETVRPQCRHQAGLWYHAIAMMNCYYSVCDELIRVVPNSGDPILRSSVEQWRDRNQDKRQNFFGNARNVATHQGAIQTSLYVTWEDDFWNDTAHPVHESKVSVRGNVIKDMSGDEFLALAEESLRFLQRGISEIAEFYKVSGGEARLLSEEKDYFDELRDFDL